MATNSRFSRSLSCVSDYDDGEVPDEDDDDDRGNRRSRRHKRRSTSKALALPNHLFMVSLIDHLCKMYMPDTAKCKILFQTMCKQLEKMSIMGPLSPLDEMDAIRNNFKSVFAQIIQSGVSILGDDDLLPGSNNPTDNFQRLFEPRRPERPSLSIVDLLGIQASRYASEFVQDCCIGGGAFGEVFKVHHRLDQCPYAVKKIPIVGATAEEWQKMLREVTALAQLNHPHIVRYYAAWVEFEHEGIKSDCKRVRNGMPLPEVNDMSISTSSSSNGSRHSTQFQFEHSRAQLLVPGEQENSDSVIFQHSAQSTSSNSHALDVYRPRRPKPSMVLYIQMEYCDNGSLKEWMVKRNDLAFHTQVEDMFSRVDEELNIRIVTQLLKALEFIHEKDLIHRDVKPENIFLVFSRRGLEVKLGDFGLARRNSDQPMTPHAGHSADVSWNPTFTSGVGTATYAAPEQLTSISYDSKADMFSLGLVIYEMFHPFRAAQERGKCLQKLRQGDVPADFKARWPEVARHVCRLVSPNPENRPSASDLLHGDLVRTKDQQIQDLQEKLEDRDQRLEAKDQEIAELRRQLSLVQANIPMEHPDGTTLVKKTQTETTSQEEMACTAASRSSETLGVSVEDTSSDT